MPNKYEAQAAAFCDAIRELATKPENLDKLKCYLSNHFRDWLAMSANTPDALCWLMLEFANMEV